ncbi:hypothetical protein J8Y17_10465 [Bacillus cereus]|uniref:hypothetical protein n=1 Tax=Bacillus cereus TaxID=1396 RepID=UPI001B8D96BE|nr:hypothetical protein [Bacillus cereus]MDD0821567.1 hypothetical protein [Bacillus cereus]QUW33635.1 hypothetical protein J8Y17_10465 [Bacillus cereus]
MGLDTLIASIGHLLLWGSIYYLIGIIFVSFTVYPITRDIALKNKEDNVYMVATFIISLAFIICLAPFWIILLFFKIAKLINKDSNAHAK